MNRIKFSTTETKDYPIEQVLYEQKTGKNPAFFSIDSNGHKTYFAICPGCNNPVQLIGLYKKSNHTEVPYAKHICRNTDLARFHLDVYEYCPFRAKRKPYIKTARRKGHSELSQQIVTKLVRNFGKVLSLVRKWTGIAISENLAEDMLRDYFAFEGHAYVGSSIVNVPLMFAYFAVQKKLYGRFLMNNEAGQVLKQSLVKSGIDVTENRIKTTQYRKIGFAFIHHNTTLDQETRQLTETLKFIVVEQKGEKLEYLFEKIIKYSPEESDLLFSYISNNPVVIKSNFMYVRLAQRVAAEWGFKITL